MTVCCNLHEYEQSYCQVIYLDRYLVLGVEGYCWV